MVSRAQEQGLERPTVMRNVVDFLFLYGHFVSCRDQDIPSIRIILSCLCLVVRKPPPPEGTSRGRILLMLPYCVRVSLQERLPPRHVAFVSHNARHLHIELTNHTRPEKI